MNRSMPLFVVAIVGVLFFSGGQVSAAEILLKNGNSGTGNVLELSDTDVKVDLGGVELIYALKDVQSINGLTDVSRTKLAEMAKVAHEYTVSAKYSEALPILDQLEELALPANLDISADYAEVLDGMDRQYDKSLYYFRKALEKEPGDWFLWHKYAHALRHSHRDQAATLEAYKKAHNLQPPDVQRVLENHNTYDIGITYGEFGDWKRAMPYLEKAVFSPTPSGGIVQPYFYTFLIRAYLAIGEPQKAILLGPQALENSAPSGQIFHGLSLAFEALGQSERAALCERKAKELGYEW